jgi:16S rRNA (adenine1518-N6/adenine1519-N6)-dimethyltransferase
MKDEANPNQPAPNSSTPVHRPSKRFGQNFLTDKRTIDRIVDAVDPQPGETIVEIGPGRGALTGPLLERAGRLVAIEFDRNLVPQLRAQFGDNHAFHLIEQDALRADVCKLIEPAKQTRVVGNLPYNISTAILQKLIEQRHCIVEMVLMLQREVVDRITASPSSSERGYLSVLVEAFAETEKLFDVAPGSFRPAPKVWSTVIRVTPQSRLAFPEADKDLMWQIVSAGFAQRRKTILNNLRNAPSPLKEKLVRLGGASIVLCRAEVELQRRAETLTLDEWARIAGVVE